jgi:hypothetical protein
VSACSFVGVAAGRLVGPEEVVVRHDAAARVGVRDGAPRHPLGHRRRVPDHALRVEQPALPEQRFVVGERGAEAELVQVRADEGDLRALDLRDLRDRGLLLEQHPGLDGVAAVRRHALGDPEAVEGRPGRRALAHLQAEPDLGHAVVGPVEGREPVLGVPRELELERVPGSDPHRDGHAIQVGAARGRAPSGRELVADPVALARGDERIGVQRELHLEVGVRVRSE